MPILLMKGAIARCVVQLVGFRVSGFGDLRLTVRSIAILRSIFGNWESSDGGTSHPFGRR